MSIENGSSSNWPEKVIIYTDGASRGNPGAASIGFVVYDEDNNIVYEFGKVIGVQTNNVAEYEAVKTSLELAVQNKVSHLTLRSDSQLLIRQLLGEYKVKSEGLIPLFKECKNQLAKIKTKKFEHVARELNKRADHLANLALDS